MAVILVGKLPDVDSFIVSKDLFDALENRGCRLAAEWLLLKTSRETVSFRKGSKARGAETLRVMLLEFDTNVVLTPGDTSPDSFLLRVAFEGGCPLSATEERPSALAACVPSLWLARGLE